MVLHCYSESWKWVSLLLHKWRGDRAIILSSYPMMHLQKCPSILSICTSRAEKSTMAVDAFKKSDESYSSKIYPLCLMIPWFSRKNMQCRGHCPSILVNLETCCTDLYIANPRRKCLQRFAFVVTKLFVSLQKTSNLLGLIRKIGRNLQEIFPVKQTWQRPWQDSEFLSLLKMPFPAPDL